MINKIILTASGGPFRGKDLEYLKHVTVKDALNHPNWSMGRKITIDSSTLMNKGLEVIEAKFLFDVKPEQIEIVVHPQSIVHSGIEFCDHSTIAQLGLPDMRVPIQFALFYPNRMDNNYKSLSLAEIGKLTFEKPNLDVFKCLSLALESLNVGGTLPTVLNAANEAAVELFLNGTIDFLDIGNLIEQIMEKHVPVKIDSIDTVLEAEKWTRNKISEYYK
jgi:1-deoxy-D-xylulose-5-phosphate reductoisomerase